VSELRGTRFVPAALACLVVLSLARGATTQEQLSQPEPAPASHEAPTNQAAQSQLTGLTAAVHTAGEVTVAGTLDRDTVTTTTDPGGVVTRFSLIGPEGESLPVTCSGELPSAGEGGDVVVVVGVVSDGVLQARKVLIPGVVARTGVNRGLAGVATITLIIWIGLFAYVLTLERKLRRLETS